jgi:tetratricopeptide (TPR) repeat protein
VAYCAYQTKSFEKAIGYFDESIKLDYKKETAFLYKANSYKYLKKDDEYVKTLEDALTNFPDNEKVKGMLAIVYLKEANVFYTSGAKILKDAAADVAAAKYKTTDPQYKDAESKAKEEFKKALPILEKALSFDPENATGKQLKAACEQMLKG